MDVKRISSMIALSLISPLSLSASTQSSNIEKSTSIHSSHRRMKHQLMVTPQLQPMGTYVGEIQERWQFPSDHLPVGISYQNDIQIGSWNVLDAKYMSWVFKNSQGLSRSQIIDEHIYLDGSKLTLRDTHIADLVVEMLTHPTHPRSILSLQECSQDFIQHLKGKLPQNFQLIAHHGNAMLIDQNRFDVKSATEVFGAFSENSARSFQEIVLIKKDSGDPLRLFNVHLPGDPMGPGRFEFARYLAKTYDPNLESIAMGDMNFNEFEMRDALLQVFSGSDFQLFSPYCTNVSVAQSDQPFTSKAIDHFVVFSTKSVQNNQAEDLLIGLDSIVRLLQP